MSSEKKRDEDTKPGRLVSSVSSDAIPLTPIPDPERISAVSVTFPEGIEPTPITHERLPGPLHTDQTPVTAERHQRRPRPSDEYDTDVWFGNPQPHLSEPEHGERIIADRYQILERIATGGMARIYKVRHLNLGKEFALKLIDDQSDAARRIQQLFFREARIAGVMDHPNIVQVTDFGEDDTLGTYIVMEHLKGETLFHLVRKTIEQNQSLHLSAVLDIGLQIADALHYMHGQNIIHCDIKSENIFLCTAPKEKRQRPHVKLIDFGLSRTRASGLQLARAEVAGTPAYMAPELLKGRAPNPSMDIYSLGVLFYEMLAGRLPFSGTLEEVIHAQLHETPVPLSQVLTEPLDERVEAFVMKALNKEPRLRSESMGRVIFELRTLMEMLNFREARPVRTLVGKPIEPPQTDYQRFFKTCPCPLVQLDGKGRITSANRAFRHFVGISKRETIGRLIDTTRLAYVYPNIASDLGALRKRKNPQTIQRVLSFTQPDGKRIPMMFWLTPELDEKRQVTAFFGTIHPLLDKELESD